MWERQNHQVRRQTRVICSCNDVGLGSSSTSQAGASNLWSSDGTSSRDGSEHDGEIIITGGVVRISGGSSEDSSGGAVKMTSGTGNNRGFRTIIVVR